ncbi:MAG: glycosyltransferase [Bacteroidales bacterium]|jgi:glycosyltransferase involved in cell wall biosynthesis|nr:glycosyltransferase [Bacteroidales bacterium]
MLSVVICTYNREKYIYNALKSVAEQCFPHKSYEIIIINNNSNDKTEELCFKFHQDFPEVQFSYFIEYRQGLSFARNRGIQESKGEIILFLDDDATAVPCWLSEYDIFFTNYPDAIAAGGPIIPCFESEKPEWISPIIEQLLGGKLYYGKNIIPFKNRKYPGGGNAAYRKKAFELFGLFNTELGRKGSGLEGSEEKDMFDRFRNSGNLFYYLPKAIIHHFISEKKLSLDYFKQLSIAIGIGEKKRTLSISKKKYIFRLFQEVIKWGASIILFIGYSLILQPKKGWKLLQFRWYLSKGLFGKKST